MKKKGIIFSIVGIFIIIRNSMINKERSYNAIRESERVNAINRTMFHWISNHVDEAFFEEYFRKRRISKIAIYGTASLGELFFYYVKNSGVEIAYLMDKAISDTGCFQEIPLFGLDYEGEIPEVDAIIVTPVYYFDEIKNDLEARKIKAKKILSIERIVSV